jgi:excisionase family DNA binding protein
MQERLLFSRREAAILLNLSLRTLDNLVARGELRVRRVGRRRLVERRELERFSRQDHRVSDEIRNPVDATG